MDPRFLTLCASSFSEYAEYPFNGDPIQVRFAEHFVDPALGFCTGINFFVFNAVLIPFEMVAFNVVLHFWTDKIPVAAVICAILIAYMYNFFLGSTEYVSDK